MTPKALEKRNGEAKLLLLRWFRRMLSDGETYERFELLHLGSANTDAKDGMRIAQFKPEHFKDMSPEEMTRVVFEAIEDDKQIQDGMQRYLVLRWVVNYGEPQGRQALDVLGRIISDPDAENSVYEPANEKGMIALLMRHQEGIMKLAVTGSSATIRSLTDSVREKDEIIARLMSTHFQTFAAGEEFLNQKQEREFELEKKRRNAKFMEGAFEKAMPLLMTMMSRFLLPSGSSGESGAHSNGSNGSNGHGDDPLKMSYVLTHALVEKLAQNPENMTGLVGLFAPAEQAGFMELYRIHSETQGVPSREVAQVSFVFVQSILEVLAEAPEKMVKLVGILSDETKAIFQQIYQVHHKAAVDRQQSSGGGNAPPVKEKVENRHE